MGSRPAVFIEKQFPVKLLNEQVYYEHGGNPFKGLHRWYSRKPLSFSRASVLASVLPDTVTMEEFEYLLGLRPEREGLKPDPDLRLYKTPPGALRIQKVHALCEELWGDVPAVLDAFAGGGSIPFEAARYGFRVFASDLNPVAVVTMKAAMEFPLQFGADLQVDIDRWVKWVGDEAEQRLAEFFPVGEGETVQNYLWAHTVDCPSCGSVVPLSPNWWLSKTSNYAGKGQARTVTADWYAVKPIPNPAEKRVDFELIKGPKGKGSTIQTPEGDFDPSDFNTLSRGVGKCPNCDGVIEGNIIKKQGSSDELGHQLYAVAYKKNKSSLSFRNPNSSDLAAYQSASEKITQKLNNISSLETIPNIELQYAHETHERQSLPEYGLTHWHKFFNPRQLLTLVTYVEIINEVKERLQVEYEPEKVGAIATYLALVLDRCVDRNCRLSIWHTSRSSVERASTQHALNLTWNYPEISGNKELWRGCADPVSNEYQGLCDLLGTKNNSSKLKGIEQHTEKTLHIENASADSLFHLDDQSIDSIVTDPPYYATIQYAELSDFFYVWQKRILGDVFPDLYLTDLTDKDREAVANPSRFRGMGDSPEQLANQDYEAKMEMAFSEYHRVLKENGVMTVQFNHKDSGAWDVLAQSLIEAGFEITASWAVNTENPQNLHQAKKNSVSSTVLLVCRKRDPDAPQAWWDEVKIEVRNAVLTRAPELETALQTETAQGITAGAGIDLYLSAFGPALNIFSRAWPVLDSSGATVRPEQAFTEARKAIANYRFDTLVKTDTAGFDALTQWYLLAWDAFAAREFPFDEARQLALAIGGFNVNDLAKTFKLISSTSGTCKLLTPAQRQKKRAFAVNDEDFSGQYLVDGLMAAIAIYDEEENLQILRRFLKNTGLLENDYFIKTLEVAFRVLPQSTPEYQTLLNIWLGMEEIKAKVVVEQLELNLGDEGQLKLNLPE
ncbi:DUF1156 domain-containing protein [Spirulina major]|uniref:DUF1156 domain-containing protein n=1 Tax=Spirulina major TaxID=270636 RepID=UPI0009338674|nr:DUF1156 domain-containing protein [Spirulina major]